MRKLREILRLREINRGMSMRQMAVGIRASPTTISKYLKLIERHDLSVEGVSGMSDDELWQLISPDNLPGPSKPPPDFEQIRRDLTKKGVTLQLLWEEYREIHSDGYKFSRFCQLYREWSKQWTYSMRQNHKAGERLFVDYAGQTVDIVRAGTGEVYSAAIFVAAMGASNFTFLEATLSQKIDDWLGSHIRCFEAMGAVPEILVPDNLKSGVTKACFYDPDINPAYQELAKHYNVAVLPARAKKPKDKAKAEKAVQHVSTRVLAAIRKQKFFSLSELNEVLKKLNDELNNAPFQKMDGTRRQWFDEIDKPAMKPLPTTRFEVVNWKKATVNIDYHVEVNKHYYSVPYRLVGEIVAIRFTKTTLEILHDNKRVASHLINKAQGRHTTVPEHMPKSHQRYSEWTPSRLIKWGNKIGAFTGQVITEVLSSRPHPEQGFRSALGILRLSKTYGEARLDAACGRAFAHNTSTYKSIKLILENKMDGHEVAVAKTAKTPTDHNNVRGGDYYN